MRPEEEFFKKKKKKSRRVTKTIFILLFIIVIAAIILYSFENPLFFSGIKNKLLSFYNVNKEAENLNDKTKNLKGVTGEEKTSEEKAVEKDKEIAVTLEQGEEGSTVLRANTNDNQKSQSTETSSMQANQAKNKAYLLWERIINFFKEKMGNQEEEFPARLKIKVYFASLGEQKEFVYEERTIIAGNLQTATENAVMELLKGPKKSYHYPVIPPGTKLIGVEIYQNLAKINLSQEFLENSLETGILDEYVIYTIVNTVTEIPEIEGVIFLIEGTRIKFYGNVDLSIPAIRNEKYLKSDNQEG